MTVYLKRLAIENSSAFSSLLGKILLMQVGSDPDSDGGAGVILFTRQIVYPGGQVVTDQTPKQIAPSASHTLPKDDEIDVEAEDINDLDA